MGGRSLCILFFLALAGCVAPSADVASTSADFPLVTFRLGVASLDAPSLAVTSEGALYVAGVAEGARAVLLRSLDEGATWTDVSPRPTFDASRPGALATWVHAARGDARVALAVATGRLEAADVKPEGDTCSWVGTTTGERTEAGESWRAFPLACDGSGHGVKVLAFRSDDRDADAPLGVVVCARRSEVPEGTAGCSRATGAADALAVDPLGLGPFAPSTTPFFSCPVRIGPPRAAPDGTLLVPAIDCGVPSVARSEDAGATWSVVTVAPRLAEAPEASRSMVVDVDDAGVAYAVWLDAGLPRMAWSGDGARTWSPPASVPARGVTAADRPAIAARGEGRVAVAFVGTDALGGYAARPTSQGEEGAWADAEWRVHVTLFYDARVPAAATRAVLADGGDPVARGACGWTECGGMSAYLDATIDEAGRVWVAFTDVCYVECLADAAATKDPPLQGLARIDAWTGASTP